MKKILIYIVTFVILIILFNLLLFLSSLIPSNWIENNVKESSQTLLKEGPYPLLSKKFNVVTDNPTDAIMINTCYSIDNSNPLFSYMSARKNYKEGLTQKELTDTNGELISISESSKDGSYHPIDELKEFLDGNVDTSIEYARYWHGYLPILRILLIFFNITEIRFVIFILFVALFITLCILLKRKFGYKIVILFCYTLIIEDFFFVSYSLGSAPIFITMMLANIILLIKLDKIKNIYLYFFIIGCISNYVDFLTVPLVTLGMPLLIYLLYMQKSRKLSLLEGLKIVIGSGALWTMGYGLTWFSKWAIYDIIYNKDLIQSAILQVMYRSVGKSQATDITIWSTIGNFIFKNLVFIIMFVIAQLIYVYSEKKDIVIDKKILKEIVPILLVSILPFIWYVLLSNHSILHSYFTYRNMLIFTTGILIILNKALIDYKKD